MLHDNVLDTLGFQNSEIRYKKFHQERTQETFKYLGIDQDFSGCYKSIEKNYAPQIKNNECVRVVFSISNPPTYTAELKKIEPLNSEIILASSHITTPNTRETTYKWENREFWDKLLTTKPARADDLLVINQNNEIVETSRFNIFCFKEKSGVVCTPPLESGCLNGVFRRFIISEGFIFLPQFGQIKIVEQNIKLDELVQNQLFVGNSVRGLLSAVLMS